MKIFSIVGWSGSGKTRLIQELILNFKRKKLTIMAVKSAPEKYDLQPAGKDTQVYLASGCDEVCLLGSSEILRMQHVDNQQAGLALIQPLFSSFDLVLLEGISQLDVPLLEVFDSNRVPGLKFAGRQLTAHIGDKPLLDEVPYFERDDVEGIAVFLEGLYV